MAINFFPKYTNIALNMQNLSTCYSEPLELIQNNRPHVMASSVCLDICTVKQYQNNNYKYIFNSAT